MLIELDQDNYIKIDPEQGCRIQELKIGGKCVVKYDEKDGFLGSGSYLMFPWVNRVV
jgi:galactose mutarotase-like enzyme